MYTTLRFFKSDIPEPLIIGIFKKNEIESLAALAKQTYSETYPGYFTPRQLDNLFGIDFMRNQVPREFEDKNCLYLTLKVNETMVGYAKLIFKQNTSVLIDKLYFLQEYQGKGYGTLLLKACFQEAQNRHCSMLLLKVWTENKKAIEFYKKYGFTVDGDPHPFLNEDGSPSDDFDFLMTCKIHEHVEEEELPKTLCA